MPSMRRVGQATEPRNSRSLPISEMLSQHLLQVAGDGDLLDRIGELAVGRSKSAGAAREIAGHQVDSEAEKLGDVKAIFDLGDDLLRSLCAGLQKEVAGADAGGSGQPARGVAGGRRGRVFWRRRCSAGKT